MRPEIQRLALSVFETSWVFRDEVGFLFAHEIRDLSCSQTVKRVLAVGYLDYYCTSRPRPRHGSLTLSFYCFPQTQTPTFSNASCLKSGMGSTGAGAGC